METIPLNGEDLTLYPVYEKTVFLDSDNFVIVAVENAEKPAPTSTTITAKEAVSWGIRPRHDRGGCRNHRNDCRDHRKR